MSDLPILTHIPLYGAQPVFLRGIANRGGEISWRWDNPAASPAAYDMAADLIQRGLVRYAEVVTHADQPQGRTCLQLTDLGRRVVGKLEDAERQRVEVANPSGAVPV